MITIVKAKDNIVKLWGKQQIHEEKTYRLMKYVLRVDHEDTVLLHNVVTGQLVSLNKEEVKLLDKLPAQYNSTMNQLIDSCYLVPVNCDEHQKVVGIREVLRTIEEKYQESGITRYTILPTTACNARCFYCYEQGLKTVTMSEKTADDVIKFIVKNSEGKRISIRWFGGEPTVAIPRIDQICRGLRDCSIDFSSIMTTNGYLLNEDLVMRIKEEWNLHMVMISMDGCEANYNRIKAYVNAKDNPYQRVLSNIGILLKNKIYVNLRMNFDYNNYEDFSKWLNEIETLYKANSYLQVRSHQINPHYPGADLDAFWAGKQWYNDKMIEMEKMLRDKGFLAKGFHLPCLKYRLCSASNNNTIVINPDGSLVKCPDSLEPEQSIGNVNLGITDRVKELSWKLEGDYEHCHECVLYPDCVNVANCKSAKECLFEAQKMNDYRDSMVAQYASFFSKREVSSNGFNTFDNPPDCII